MKRGFYVLLMSLVFGSVAFAADPDFSGSWALEQENGFVYGTYKEGTVPFPIQTP